MSKEPVEAVLPCGSRAVLVELHDWVTVSEVDRHARIWWRGHLVESVPAEHSLMLQFDRHPPPESEIRELVGQAARYTPPRKRPDPIEIPVVYDGEDLEAVARACGISQEEVVELHSGTVHEVAFFGFRPGFPYLTGLPAGLHLPRRSEPRVAVPAGSVAIASHYTGIYPFGSPGGWHLIGRTEVRLIDEWWKEPVEWPFLLSHGGTVRFVP